MRTGYLTALICRNGHVLTDELPKAREFVSIYCTLCGQETISECTECKVSIRGASFTEEYREDWISGIQQIEKAVSNPKRLPYYCHNCGKPYPWTEKTLEAARELIDETEDLSEDDKDKLKQSLSDLLTETPGTTVAIVRVKKWLPKAGLAIAKDFKEVMVNVVAEVVRRQLGF